ncbi:hypothetical protein, partial [Micromonospora qiuiae]|uniref:hypothetical protein n=1 Tax=Micromonospora qiuiae TaxID=502268 RepID=UPI0019525B90
MAGDGLRDRLRQGQEFRTDVLVEVGRDDFIGKLRGRFACGLLRPVVPRCRAALPVVTEAAIAALATPFVGSSAEAAFTPLAIAKTALAALATTET